MAFVALEGPSDRTPGAEQSRPFKPDNQGSERNRMSKIASAKLPSLIHSSPACASCIKVRKAGTSAFPTAAARGHPDR